MSSSWHSFGLGEVGDPGVGETEVDIERAVPGQGLVRADRVELDAVLVADADEVEGVIDLLAVETLVFQRLEAALSNAGLPGGLGPGSDVTRFGPSGDERAEAEGPERTPVVGHERDRDDLAGVRVCRVLQQRGVAEETLRFGEGELEGLNRVVLVRGR